MGMVKKLHGKAVAFEVVDDLIQEVYKSEVLDSSDHQVIGSPTVTKLEYEPDGDLNASIQFGVKPQIELADISGESFKRLTHEVDESEVEQEIERLRARSATFESVEDAAGEDDFVRVDLQELDEETDTPIVGSKREGVVFHLGADDLDQSVKSALEGSKTGDTARFSVSHHGSHHDHDHDHGDDHDHDHDHSHEHRFEATVVDVQKRILPELDDELASNATQGRVATAEELRDDIRKQLTGNWDQALRDKLEDEIVRKLVELHEFEVPVSVIETYLDSLVQDVAQRNEGKLPEGFDVEYFRQQNREEAERMARWMLIREQIIEQHEIAVESDDLDEAFDGMGGGESGSGESVRKMFEQHYPDMITQMERRIESRKVFDWLLDQVKLEDEEWVDDRDQD